jgi:hypothetical protein
MAAVSETFPTRSSPQLGEGQKQMTSRIEAVVAKASLRSGGGFIQPVGELDAPPEEKASREALPMHQHATAEIPRMREQAEKAREAGVGKADGS